MKIRKSKKYKNYGPIPQNEYTNANQEKSEDAEAVLEYDPQPVHKAYKRRLVKRQAMHPTGRRKISGWSRSWKANGWRAESASRDDEISDMGRYYRYVRKRSRSL